MTQSFANLTTSNGATNTEIAAKEKKETIGFIPKSNHPKNVPPIVNITATTPIRTSFWNICCNPTPIKPFFPLISLTSNELVVGSYNAFGFQEGGQQ